MVQDIFFGAMMGGLLAIFGIFIFVLLAAIYIYTSLALMTVAKKNRTGPLWLAWIPVANVILMLKMAKLQWQWIFALLIGIIPIIGGALIMAGVVYVWWQICRHMHKPEWYAILMIVPFVNLVVLGYLAWGK
ncbi:hypothetical protein J4482_00470 [Candidatus Woesearchaeota archaeon]|nr:hypothetical protein [uncultured archaeon]MBS3115082.1 hypothetical protein [Candidatus Woesearchaeota archaeon]